MQKLHWMALVGAVALTVSVSAWTGERTVLLKVDGRSCARSAPAARKALEKVSGVKSAKVEGDRATVVVDEKVQDTDLVKAIAGAGVPATVAP